MKPGPRRTCGFTLIELTCSMAVGTVILLAAAMLLGSSGEGYERVGGGVAADREGRTLLSQLTSDLSSAVFHKDQLALESTDAWPADKLGFLCLQPAHAQSEAGCVGDLCAVTYYLKDLTIGGRTVRCLMRGFRESSGTFKAIADGTVPALFAARDDVDEPIAFGVVSLEARPRSRDHSGKWIDWTRSDPSGPESVDVRLVVARRAIVAKLRLPADWDGAGPAGGLLGSPAEADRNGNLDVYGAMIRFGNHEAS